MDKKGVYLAEIKHITYKNFNNIKDVKFLKENGEVYPWTIFLGNNGTGKTNLLKILSSLETKEEIENTNKKEQSSKYYETKDIISSNHYRYEIKFRSSIRDFIWKRAKNNNVSSYSILYEESCQNIIYAYGVNRKASRKNNLSSEKTENNATLFKTNVALINLDEWLLQTDYAAKNNQKSAKKRLNLIKEVITSSIFPDIKKFEFHTDEQLNNYVEFETNEGWFRLDDLAYGYQSTLSWIVDFCKKMFDRYPDSENPLKEAAIVLIDEIDLHLHPEWQRNITHILSNLFPKTQFIATTHSPLVVQSLEEANVYVLNKKDKYVEINRMPNKTFKGWSVEEILNKVMGLDSRVKSDTYLNLIEKFDEGIDTFNFEESKKAYDKLMEILPESDIQRRIIDMQFKQFPEAR